MVRRLVAFIAALVLAVEAVGIVIINVVMGTVVKNQDMSLAGTNPDVMSKAPGCSAASPGCSCSCAP